MPSTKVLVLYNRPLLPKDHPEAASEHMVVEIAESQAALLEKEGYHTRMLGLGPDPRLLWEELQQHRPDVVLNLYEGSLDDTETESYVAGLLHWSGVPFTGCPMPTLTLARAKHTTKVLLRAAGLPTADFFVVHAEPIPACPIPWPVIVKPATQDASVGIGHRSVCHSQEELESRVRFVLGAYGAPVLVERYIPGREIIVAITALPTLRYLPPAEILFPEPKPGTYAILTYEAKWSPGSTDYEATPPRYPADLPADVARHLGELAMRAFQVLGGRDYARVDFRLDPSGAPFILELNPNPEISDDACFGLILQTAGISFRDFLVQLIERAKSRGTPRNPRFVS